MAFLQEYKVLHEQGVQIDHIIYRGQTIWPSIKEIPGYSEPFYVENILRLPTTVKIKKNYDDAPTLTIEYSVDKEHWSSLGTTSTSGLSHTLQSGDKIYLKCNTNSWTSSNGGRFNYISGMPKVGGNIMSLLYGTNFSDKTTFPDNNGYVFSNLFYQSSTIKYSNELILPASTLSHSCYSDMFIHCTNLLNSPELPATVLASECYAYMFYGCTSLISTPVLHAPTIGDLSYIGMFKDCTSLSTITCFAENGFTRELYPHYNTYDWIENVSSDGIFIKKYGVTWPSGTAVTRYATIPSGWTIQEV